MSGAQFIEQSLGLFQVERVEPFSEPAADRGEEIASILSFALIAPEPRHAHRRPEFPGLRVLRPRYRQCTIETCLRSCRVRLGRHQRDRAGDAVAFRLAPRLLRCFGGRHGFVDRDPGIVETAKVGMRLRQAGQEPWQLYRRACRPMRGDAGGDRVNGVCAATREGQEGTRNITEYAFHIAARFSSAKATNRSLISLALA